MNRQEREAEKLLAEHGLKQVPVPIEVVADRLGAVLTYERFAPELSGMLLRGPGQPTVIGVNNRQSHRRQRFTIAHEVGHLCLHKGDVIVDNGVRVNYRDERSATATVKEEREANAFGAALLMPADCVEDAVRSLLASGTPKSMVAADLARRFEVSEEAMGYRLVNLGWSGF